MRVHLLVFQVASLLAAAAVAQEAAPGDAAKPEPNPTPSYELAEDATLDEVIAFVKAIDDYRSDDPNQSTLHTRKMRAVLPEARDRLVKLAEAAGKTDSDEYLKAKRESLQSIVSRGDEQAALAGMESVVKFLKQRTQLDAQDARLALLSSYYFVDNEAATTDKGQKLLRTLADLFPADDTGSRIRGLARRAVLVGSTVELTGAKLDGSEFDLASLRGKVVLVDFWATWCEPCIREHPNIEANYEKYHARGFEVVGVSLDRRREPLERYIAEKQPPWIVLHDEGGKNPASIRYGVVGIPSMFLIDADGKVVSTRARGEQLGVELEKLLPAKDASTASNESDAD